MHHPRHSFTIRNMRIAALMLCIKRLAVAVAIGFLLVSAMREDPRLSITGLSLLGATLLFTVIQWMFASAAKCPLCMMPVLSRKGCSRHRHAKSFFGSQRLRVALSILLKGSFRCPYCNEPTILRLKGLP